MLFQRPSVTVARLQNRGLAWLGCRMHPACQETDSFKIYYNEAGQCLEHFRFPEIFIRRTKAANLSIVEKEFLEVAQKMHKNRTVGDSGPAAGKGPKVCICSPPLYTDSRLQD